MKWKDINGYEGLYMVSDEGEIYSYRFKRKLSRKAKIGQYITVSLTNKYGARETKRIHRLVAETFISNPDNKPEVNHKDMNRHNNSVENLEWVTKSENIQHAVKNKPDYVKPMINYNKFEKPKRIFQYSLSGELLGIYPNSVVASRCTGVCYRNILQVASKDEYKPGKIRSQAGGYKWRFAND